ncbi:hypothetical protein IAR50_003058 [Cryptococcus sp. DSM 104548]
MSPHLPRADAHTSDGSSDPNESFMDKYSPWSYVILAGVCAIVLLFCLYALWRGPQRAFFPVDALLCHRKNNKKSGAPTPLGKGLDVEGSRSAKEGAKGDGQKTVYLTDMRRQAHNTLQKKHPPGLAANKEQPRALKVTSTERKREEQGRRAQRDASWTGTVSSFGHPASMMEMGSRPQLQRQTDRTHPGSQGASELREVVHTPRGRMDGQSGAPYGGSSYGSRSSVSLSPRSMSMHSQQTYASPSMGQPTTRTLRHAHSGSTPNRSGAPPKNSPVIYAPSPVHVRSRSVGTSPMVPSPLSTPLVPAVTQDTTNVPISAPGLSPRVQFSPLPHPMRDSHTANPLSTTPPIVAGDQSKKPNQGNELGMAI